MATLVLISLIVLVLAVWYVIYDLPGCSGNCQQGQYPCDCGRSEADTEE